MKKLPINPSTSTILTKEASTLRYAITFAHITYPHPKIGN